LRMHRYQGKEQTDFEEDSEGDEDESATTPIYEKRDKLLQGAAASLRRKDGRKKKVRFLTKDFMKKFIEFAKKKAEANPPLLTDEAREAIAQKYAEIRSDDSVQTLPITARCLETIIRLASAHAKLRVSNEITVDDVDAVYKVLTFALTNDALPSDGTEMAEAVAGMNIEGDDDENEEDEMFGRAREDQGMDVEGGSPRKGRKKRKKPMDHASPQRMVQAKSFGESIPSRAAAVAARSQTDNKAKALGTFIVGYWRSSRASNVGIKQLTQLALKDANLGFSTADEVAAAVKALEKAEKVFVNANIIYRI